MNVIEKFRLSLTRGDALRRRTLSGRLAAWVWVAMTAVLAGGCADMRGLAPELSPVAASSLKAGQSLAGTATDPAAWPSEDWWLAFNDPQLDRLMREAVDGSPSLAIAAARTRRALADAAVSDSARYPQVGASLASTRERFSEHGLVPPPYGGSWQTVNALDLTLSWEIDFWGKNRAAYESALGAARAADVDAYAARLALTTAVASRYAELQREFERRDVAQKTLADREQLYNLTRDRVAAGLDSQVELKQAEAAIPATREVIIAHDERIALLRNEIAALLGAGPDRGLAIERPTARLVAIALPTSVPAELIGRRPDLIAQRWRLESAHAAIDSAKGAFYPNVNLLAFVGLQGIGAGNFLTAASRTAGIGPAITLPIFDAGRLRGNLAGKDADYDIAVARYDQLIADAIRDVVDQLASLRSVASARIEQRRALAAAKRAYELSLIRYREGLGNYLQVLSAEQPMLVQEALDADLDARELALSIALVRALGGGFTPAPDTPRAVAVADCGFANTTTKSGTTSAGACDRARNSEGITR